MNDCDSTRSYLNNECHCKPRTVLGSVGECEPCPLGYHLDNPLLGQCINCPLYKITKTIGSSNFSHCICPKSEFDDETSCVKCPKFANCEYGEITTVLNGYMVNLEKGLIQEMLPSLKMIAYMDDVVLIGDLNIVKKATACFKELFTKIGLRLNLFKCVLLSNSPVSTIVDGIEIQAKLYSIDAIRHLGLFLGNNGEIT
ncbi:hypothetical protein P9112_009636 [Eukaryota sp. TZLM1-RC]